MRTLRVLQVRWNASVHLQHIDHVLVLFRREAEKADFLPLERFQPVTFGELFHVGRKVRIVTVLPRLHDPAGADHGQPEGHCVPGGDGTQREERGDNCV